MRLRSFYRYDDIHGHIVVVYMDDGVDHKEEYHFRMGVTLSDDTSRWYQIKLTREVTLV